MTRPSKPYMCKFIWASEEFKNELQNQSRLIQQQRGLKISPADLTYQLYNDLREGRIKIDIETIKFRKMDMMNIGGLFIRPPK